MALSEDQHGNGAALNARAAVVNRTHRIVRERATAIQARKRSVRDLILPFLICSTLLMLIANAVWTMGDDTLVEEIEGSIWHRVMELGGDAGSNISILLVWFLPISVLTAAIVLFRRHRLNSSDREGRR